MVTLDYNIILGSQYKENREYRLIFSVYFFVRSFLPVNWLLKRANKKLTAQLLGLRGAYAYLSENSADLKDKDLEEQIEWVEGTIKHIYIVENDLERHLIDTNSSEYKKTHEIVTEILEVMYDTLRLLKKNTLKKPMSAISEEAEIAVGYSKKTMRRILYGR